MVLGIFDLGFEYDRISFRGSFADTVEWLGTTADFDGSTQRVGGRVAADILPERLSAELETEWMSYDLDLDDALAKATAASEAFDTFEAIFRGRLGIAEDWSILGDLRTIVYADVPAAAADTLARAAESDDELFFAPYLALVYSPRENVEVRLGYGVDPVSYVDTPVEGRPNGRERWRSRYLWEHSEHGLLDAEQALQDARMIGVMAVIAF